MAWYGMELDDECQMALSGRGERMRKTFAIIFSMVAIGFSFAQTYKTPLKLTSPRISGPEVLAVQNRLVELGFSRLGSADGWFGPLTKDAISSFQQFYGFKETGIVDSLIWSILFVDTRRQAEIESVIKESNAILVSRHTKVSHDIMDRSTEGGSVDQYFSNNKIAIEDFTFYGEMGRVESKVIHVTGGIVVLKKEYQYPQPFDLDHATVEHTAYYFLGKTSIKVTSGKIENSEIESLPIYDLIGKTGT